MGHESDFMAQLEEEDHLSTEDLADLDRLADADIAQTLVASSENNPTLMQMIASDPSMNPNDWHIADLDAFLAGLGKSPSPPGAVEAAGGSLSGSR